MDSYRAIDRFGPVRGPVCDRSKDRSSVYSTSNTEEHCENPYKGEQENEQEGTVELSRIVGYRFTDPDRSDDRSIWNQSDDRAINRSHDRANDRSLKKSILYLNERSRRDEVNKWKKVMTGQSGTGPMTGQLTGPMTGQMTGPSKSRYYT